MSDFEQRFGGVARLFGQAGLTRLQRAHIAVVGIGGVGSWVVEALARSGVGELTLVDLDDLCVTNINRQLHALDGAIGQSKVAVMARRVTAINPECRVHCLPLFFTEKTAAEILAPRYDYVVDAIDGSTNKSLLIARARAAGLPVLACGAAGGRRDPTAVRIADLAAGTHDHLLRETRAKLRRFHGFPPADKKLGVACVYSTEPPVYPAGDGSVCARPEPGSDPAMDCNSGYGTAAFLTGVFGLVGAGHVVREIALGAGPSPA